MPAVFDGPVMKGGKGRGPNRPGGRPKGGKGRGKSQGKASKGQQQGQQLQSWRAGESTTTPDGRLKCFRFQRGLCNNPNCDEVHVCTVCNGNHPAKDCPRRPKSGDSAGRPANFQ